MTTSLPVIIGYGGINSAGRSSFNKFYQRLIFDVLNQSDRARTLVSLATMMGVVQAEAGVLKTRSGVEISEANIESHFGCRLLSQTLLRQINDSYFDVNNIPFQRKFQLAPKQGQPATFMMPVDSMPETLPPSWRIVDKNEHHISIAVTDNFECLVKESRAMAAQSAGQLPTGFDPASCYDSAHHPRALQMSICAASDALASLGFDWELIRQTVSPDRVAVYASNLMGQLDEAGFGGMLKAWSIGKENSSKQVALGMVSMAGDFINSYMLGNVGITAAHQGACATFLYNLQHAVQDIQSGRCEIALVGTSEAPITPEIMSGFNAAGALGQDQALLALDEGRDTPDYTRATRPFGENIGFTMAESAQYIVICSDRLAIELGATIHGAVADVFVNADGNKKSIFAPGVGNYISFGNAVALAREILGENACRHRTFVQAHGTGTPLNRTSESHVFDKIAQAFGITHWPVCAIKSYIGHSLASAAGDQINSTFGVWQHGFLPGIPTLNAVADDVHQQRLKFFQQHLQVEQTEMEAALINSKGFGGNNATALMLSPYKTRSLLQKRYGTKIMNEYLRRHESIYEQAKDNERRLELGQFDVIYEFNKNVLNGDEIQINEQNMQLPGYAIPVDFNIKNPYAEFV